MTKSSPRAVTRNLRDFHAWNLTFRGGFFIFLIPCTFNMQVQTLKTTGVQRMKIRKRKLTHTTAHNHKTNIPPGFIPDGMLIRNIIKKRLIIHIVSYPFRTGTLCGQDECRSLNCRRRAPQAPHQCRRSRFRGSIRICRRCGRHPSRRRGNSRY